MAGGDVPTELLPIGANGYIPKTRPYAHQLEAFNRTERAPVFAYMMEMRTGKTKLTIDIICAAYERGAINGALIVAPKGVDRNWITDEIPVHMPDRVKRIIYLHRAQKHGQVTQQRLYDHLMNAKDHLAVLVVNVEAFSSKNAIRLVENFLRKRRVLFALDESASIKTPKAKRTKTLTRLSRIAKAHRILDGAPAAENPLELFAQYRWLDPKIIGMTNFTVFKARYAEYEKGFDPRTGREFPKLVGYAHISELKAKVAPYTYRVLSADVLDMPKKIYQKVYYELSPEQRRVYEELREQYKTELFDGTMVVARNVLSRYLRLQQVLSNRFPSDAFILCPACNGAGCEHCEDAGVIDNPTPVDRIVDPTCNPRLEALEGVLKNEPGKPTIIWTRFLSEATEIMRLCKTLGRKPVRYDGSVEDELRAKNKADYNGGVADVFVGSPAAGGRGLTLSVTELMVYYSHYFALRLRLQSEERGEKPGKAQGTGVVDILAEDTVDLKIVESLRAKRSLSNDVMGDPHRDWL